MKASGVLSFKGFGFEIILSPSIIETKSNDLSLTNEQKKERDAKQQEDDLYWSATGL